MRKFRLTSNLIINGIIFSFLVLLEFNVLVAYPDMIRKGFTSCQGCHVSPSGGGLLTQYGRMISADELSTWGKSIDPIFPDWLNLGLNYRHAYIKTETSESNFPMLMDTTISLKLLKGLSLVASLGVYSRDKNIESHQAYLIYSRKLDKKTTVNIRAGKFMPNYGIMIADHTRLIRRHHLIKRGQETLNIEGSIIGKHGELFVNSIMGETDLDENYGLSYKKSFKAKQGFSAKTSLFLAKTLKLSYSMMYILSGLDEKQSHAISLSASPVKDLYILSEIDYQKNQDNQSHELGYELLKGLVLYSGLEGEKDYLYGFRWFPYNYIEFQIEQRDESFLSQLHYYF